MALVQADRTLIPNAIEESLRIDAPVHGLFRTNNCPVTLQGVEIPQDSKALMLFGSANRDRGGVGRARPLRRDRELTDLRKRHAAFGVGVHYCLGAPLSRIEGAVALEAILDRMPRIRPDGPPTSVKASVLNGFESAARAVGLSADGIRQAVRAAADRDVHRAEPDRCGPRTQRARPARTSSRTTRSGREAASASP